MKKILSFFLSLVLMFCLVGCIGDGEEKDGEVSEAVAIEIPDTFVAGFGLADITPYESVPLGGFGNEADRFSIGYLDYMYAMTVALSDAEGNTVLLIVTDLSWGTETLAAMVRTAITAKYQIPEEHILVGGTHNHEAPTVNDDSYPEIQKYNKYWLKSVVESVDMALEDRQPASMQTGRTETENLTFVRRYWQEDGNFTTDNYQVSESPVVAHESEADEEIQMLRFVRENAEDIMIVNWQTHTHKSGMSYNATTDFVGPLRNKVADELDCHCIFFQGACGNLNPTSRIEGECYTETAKELGEAVADYVIAASKTENCFSDVASDVIQTQQTRLQANHKDGGVGTMELNTIAFGDVSIVTFPVEVFDITGMQIKDQTPFDMTLLMGYTNGLTRYCPPKEQYANGGYEVNNCVWASGTAEEIVGSYLDTLNKLH